MIYLSCMYSIFNENKPLDSIMFCCGSVRFVFLVKYEITLYHSIFSSPLTLRIDKNVLISNAYFMKKRMKWNDKEQDYGKSTQLHSKSNDSVNNSILKLMKLWET